jgi:hypothetical protein
MLVGQLLIGVLFVVLASFLLPVVLLLLLPGRKGTMRTRLEVVHGGASVEEIAELYARRMEHDGFSVDRSNAPVEVTGRRERKLSEMPGSDEAVTHASKSTSVRVSLAPHGGGGGEGVDVTAEAWLNDFVIFDTGERRYLDLLLHRLTEADLDREPAAVVPLPSVHAMIALSAAALTAAAPWMVPWAPLVAGAAVDPTGARWAMLAGALIGGVSMCVNEARAALRDAAAKPGEIKGSTMARLAVGVALLGAAIGAGRLVGWW